MAEIALPAGPIDDEAPDTHGPVEFRALEAVPDDGFIVPVGNMGAPAVLVEQIPSGDEPLVALFVPEG